MQFVAGATINSAQGGRVAMLRELMADVEKHYGIIANSSMQDKLLRAFNTLNDAVFAAWHDHMKQLRRDDPEWVGLIETLTVHETYFCRDMPTLEVMSREILPLIIQQQEGAGFYSINLWSAACSSGEEPYTLAFLLLQALVDAGHAQCNSQGEITVNPKWQIQVTGSDISNQILTKARTGVYTEEGLGSFRNMPARYRSFFDRVTAEGGGTEHWKVRDFVKKYVRFTHHNLLSSPAVSSWYNFIMCRNVMIYFDMPAKRQVQQNLHGALMNNGFLMQGGTDVQLLTELYDQRITGGICWYRKL